MQWYPGPEGDQRIWYESDEIEQIASDELRRAGLLPSRNDPVVDLERFIEEHLGCELDQYAQLPDDVLGMTEFPVNHRPLVSISASLTEACDDEQPAPGSLGRWRATLAHEASHVFLHRYLFDLALEPMQPMSGPGRQAMREHGSSPDRLMRCLHRDVVPSNGTDWNAMRRAPRWHEVQANRGMAALLMPRNVFRRLALRAMQDNGVQAGTSIAAGAADPVITEVAATFEVSKQAAGIRLTTEQLLRS
jgi:hypothetical protein